MPLLWRCWTKKFSIVGLILLSGLYVPMQVQAADYFTRHQAYATLNCQQLKQNGSSGNCIDTLLDLANLELNQRYDQLMNRYQQSVTGSRTRTEAVDQQLLSAQYQWLQFRNQQCLFEAQASMLTIAKATALVKPPNLPASNPANPPNSQQTNQQSSQQNSNQVKLCQLTLTRERIEYLQWFLGR